MSTDDKDTDKQGTISTLKDKSLKAAGVAYIVGDAAMFAAGALEKDLGGAAGGLIWGLGSVTLAGYGNPKAEAQLKLLNRRLGHYLTEQGIEIPNTPSTAELAKEGGIIEHIEKFLYAYPSQILNAVYATGGVTTAVGGYRKNVKGDFAKGALVTAGGLAGILIPEKKPDPDHKPTGMLEKTWAWVQEKPLRISGLLYHANNAAAIYSIREKWKQNSSKSSLYLRSLTATSFIFANTMLALSSKGHGGGNNKDKEKVTAQLAEESARVIAAQPPALQDALVMQIAGYLAAQPEIDKKANEIASLLQAKLAEVKTEMGQSPAAKWQHAATHSSGHTAPAI